MRVCSRCQRCFDDQADHCIEDGRPISETRGGHTEMMAGYRLEYLVDAGAYSETYQARRVDCGTPCRIKILSARNDDTQLFLSESATAAALVHPNIANIYEAGALPGGELFVAAEETEGKTLRDLLNTVGVPQLLTAVQIARQTAEALHVLHQKGLTHRAVNPDNIILTSDIEQRLMVRLKDVDLGGALQNAIVTNKFLIDSATETLRYFTPEQCSNEAVSAQTDVYSAGIVLYEMLAGEPPFDGEKASALIEQHRSSRPPDLKIDNFDLRMLLTHAVMESLSKKPGQRQSSANAFARQLRHIEQLATHIPTPRPVVVVERRAPVKPGSGVIEETVTVESPYVNAPVLKTEPEPRPHLDRTETKPVPALVPELYTEYLHKIPEPVRKESAVMTTANRMFRAAAEKLSQVTSGMKRADSAAGSILPTTSAAPSRSAVLPEQPSAAKAIRKPAKIEWVQPDDVPSEEEVKQALAKGPAPAAPVIPEAVRPAPVQTRSEKKAEFPKPSEPQPEAREPVRHRAAVRKPVPAVGTKKAPALRQEPEVTTAAAARSRPAMIPVGRPAATRKRPAASLAMSNASGGPVFFPTLLGGAVNREPDTTPGDSLLSRFYPEANQRPAVPYRALLICGAVFAFAAIYLFTSGLSDRLSASGGSSVPVAERTAAEPEPLPQVEQAEYIPAAEDEPEDVEASRVATDAREPKPTKPAAVKTTTRPAAEKKDAPAARNSEKPSPAPVKPRTVEKPVQKSEPKPQTKALEKPKVSPPSNRSGLTRPRIVKEP